MTEPERHDWPKIIAEIEAAGVTLYKISVIIGRQYHIVKRWKTVEFAEPKHRDGEMLLAIHAEYVPRETVKI